MKIHTIGIKHGKAVRKALKKIFEAEPEITNTSMTKRLRKIPEFYDFKASISFGTVSAWMAAMHRGVDVSKDGWVREFKKLPKDNDRYITGTASPYRELVKILSIEHNLSSSEALKKLESIGIVKSHKWIASNFGAARRELELAGLPTNRMKPKLSPMYEAARDLVSKDNEIGYRELHKTLTAAGMVLNPLQAKDLFRKARVELNLVCKPTRTHKPAVKKPIVQTFNKDGSLRKHKTSSGINAIEQERKELLSAIKNLWDENTSLIKENINLHDKLKSHSIE